MLSNQSRIIGQAKFTYSPFDKAFEKKKIKAVEEQGKKQVEALRNLKSNIQKLTINDVILQNTWTKEAKKNLIKLKK